jgi:hypothetical protein
MNPIDPDDSQSPHYDPGAPAEPAAYAAPNPNESPHSPGET